MKFLNMFLVAVFATLALCLAGISSAQKYPPNPPSCFSPDSGKGGFNCVADRPATIPVYTAPPTFVRSVPNGKLYLGGGGNDTFHVVHLYSATDNLYEMGYAFGQLLPKEIDVMFKKIEPWLAQLLEKAVPWLPPSIAELVIKYGAPVALDFVFDLVSKYIPEEYYQEWQGMAAGANCSIEQIKRVSLFPQLSKAACTAFSSVGPASLNGAACQLRALDFDPTSYVADFSTVIIYHYKTKPQLANFGYLSLTGCLTCANYDGKLANIFGGEKMWGNHYKPFLNLPIGYPWMQMFRKAMELTNLQEINAFIDNHTTASNPDSDSVAIHLVFTDGTVGQNVGYEIGYNWSQRFAWNTPGTNSSRHPTYPGLIYFTKNSDPNTMCPADMINAQVGKIDAEWMAMYYSQLDRTGDTQMVAYDTTNLRAYVANSRKSTADGPLCAYYRQRTLLDMKALYDEQE